MDPNKLLVIALDPEIANLLDQCECGYHVSQALPDLASICPCVIIFTSTEIEPGAVILSPQTIPDWLAPYKEQRIIEVSSIPLWGKDNLITAIQQSIKY